MTSKHDRLFGTRSRPDDEPLQGEEREHAFDLLLRRRLRPYAFENYDPIRHGPWRGPPGKDGNRYVAYMGAPAANLSDPAEFWRRDRLIILTLEGDSKRNARWLFEYGEMI